jgi:L-amino acid N-acyltransferase YncA
MGILNTMEISVRKVSEGDAEAVANLLNGIVKEKEFSALNRLFTIEDEVGFFKSLGEREAVFVASVEGRVVGFLSLEIYHKALGSTGHVASVGTFVGKDFREKGVGSVLLENTIDFARENGYEKVVAEIRKKNILGLGLYRKYGFEEVGVFKNQVKINGEYDDIIVTEMFL